MKLFSSVEHYDSLLVSINAYILICHSLDHKSLNNFINNLSFLEFALFFELSFFVRLKLGILF
jgi:hypothetical protein